MESLHQVIVRCRARQSVIITSRTKRFCCVRRSQSPRYAGRLALSLKLCDLSVETLCHTAPGAYPRSTAWRGKGLARGYPCMNLSNLSDLSVETDRGGPVKVAPRVLGRHLVMTHTTPASKRRRLSPTIPSPSGDGNRLGEHIENCRGKSRGTFRSIPCHRVPIFPVCSFRLWCAEIPANPIVLGGLMVGAAGFEPTTLCPPDSYPYPCLSFCCNALSSSSSTLVVISVGLSVISSAARKSSSMA